MKSYIGIALFVVIFSVSQFGCKGSDGQMGPVGPSGPLLQGNIIGYARLANENPTITITDFRGILVTIDGTADSATTDSTGKWEIDNVKTGTWNFTFSKNGYGTNKVVRYEFVGGGNAYVNSVTLGQLPTFDVSTIGTATSGTTETVSGQITNTVPNYDRYVYIFWGKTSQVSSNPANYFGLWYADVAANTNTYSIPFNIPALASSYGLTSGDTVYVAAYADGGNSSVYTDFETQRFYYTAISTTPQKTFFKIP